MVGTGGIRPYGDGPYKVCLRVVPAKPFGCAFWLEDFPKWARSTCTKGQVFHSRYSEYASKTPGTRSACIRSIVSVPYTVSKRNSSVLGDWFKAKNVSCVP